MLSLLLFPWFLCGVCVLCLHIEPPSAHFTHRDGHSEGGGGVAEDYLTRHGKLNEKGTTLLKETADRSDQVFYGRERGRRYVGDGHVGSAPFAGSAPLADDAQAKAPSARATIVHFEQLMILKTTDSHGKIVGCTFSQRLQSAQSQRSQLARWWRRTRGAVERPASVAGFLDVAERCLETEVPAPKTSWTFRTLLKVIAPGTMWCGHGTLARDLTQLGSRSGTDRCCQIHDLCPVQLVPFVAYRGVMTAGPKTLSHCDCDRRFADCLRKVNSMGSRGVFHAYFNLAFRGNMCVTDDYLARGRSLSWASRSLLSGVGRVLRMLMRVAETDEGEGELQEVEQQEVEQQEVEQQEVEQQEVEQQEVEQQEVEQQEVEQQEEVEQQKMELRVKVQQEEEQKEEVKERQPEVEQKVKVKQQAEQQRGTEGASAATGNVNDSVTTAPGENLVNATTEESMVATTPATNEESMVATTPDENSSTTTTTTDQALTTTEENLVTTSPDGNLVSTTPSEVFIYTPPGEEFIPSPEYKLVSTGLGTGGFVLTEPEEGSPVPIQPEGSIGPMQTQGSLVPIEPEGNLFPIQPEGNSVPIEPEESLVLIELEESSVPIEAEGSLLPIEPEGSSVPIESEESSVPIELQGNIVPISPEGNSPPTEPMEGSLVFTMPEGNVISSGPQGNLVPFELGVSHDFIESGISSLPVSPEGALIPRGPQRNSVPMASEGNFPLSGLGGLLHSPVKGTLSTDLDEFLNPDGSVASGSRGKEAEEPGGILLSRLSGFTKPPSPAEVRSASPETFSSLNEVGKTSFIVLDRSDETYASSEPNTEASARESLKKASPNTEASTDEPTAKSDINNSNSDAQESSLSESKTSITVDVQSSEAEKSISSGIDVQLPSTLSPEVDSDSYPDAPFDHPEGEIEAANKYEEIPLPESPAGLDLEVVFPQFSQDFFEAMSEGGDGSKQEKEGVTRCL